MQDIIDGLVIGVGAGVTTALILGAGRWIARSKDRREQKSYIRDIASRGIEQILSSVELGLLRMLKNLFLQISFDTRILINFSGNFELRFRGVCQRFHIKRYHPYNVFFQLQKG